MRHSFENNSQGVIGRALGLGAVAGVRSMSAPALLSRAASRGNIGGIEDTPFAFLASPRAARTASGADLVSVVPGRTPTKMMIAMNSGRPPTVPR